MLLEQREHEDTQSSDKTQLLFVITLLFSDLK